MKDGRLLNFDYLGNGNQNPKRPLVSIPSDDKDQGEDRDPDRVEDQDQDQDQDEDEDGEEDQSC